MSITRSQLLGSVATIALLATATAATAGGFAVREQSVVGQGASFAGVAAGSYLSGMFWNPAVLGTAGAGFNTESVYSLISATSQIDPIAGTTLLPSNTRPAPRRGTDTGRMALVSSSYASYRMSKDLVVGLSLNAPFGLGSEPDNYAWAGRVHGETRSCSRSTLRRPSPTRSSPA